MAGRAVTGVAAERDGRDQRRCGVEGEGQAAAVAGVASEMSAAASINYAASVVTPGGSDFTIQSTGASAGTNILADNSATACNLAQLGNLFASGTFPSGYTVAGTGNCATNGAGSTYPCTVTDTTDNTATADATLVCTGP